MGTGSTAGGQAHWRDKGNARDERGGRRRWYSQSQWWPYVAGGMTESRSAPGKSLSSGLVIPQVGKVLSGAPVGKDVEEAQELPVNPARGRHGTQTWYKIFC